MDGSQSPMCHQETLEEIPVGSQDVSSGHSDCADPQSQQRWAGTTECHRGKKVQISPNPDREDVLLQSHIE